MYYIKLLHTGNHSVPNESHSRAWETFWWYPTWRTGGERLEYWI